MQEDKTGGERAADSRPDQTDDQDPFRPQASTAKPPAITSLDLLNEHSHRLDYFRGNESGRQEARDALAGVLELYDAKTVTDAILAEFRRRKAKIPVRELDAVVGAFSAVGTAPGQDPNVLAALAMLDREGLASIAARMGLPSVSEADFRQAIRENPDLAAEIAGSSTSCG